MAKKMPKGQQFTAGDEQSRQAAHNGGVKSGESRRLKRQLKDELEMLLETADTDGVTRSEGIAAALIAQALQGNTKAFEIIRDTIGQKPVDKVEVVTPDFSALDAVIYGQD